LGTFQEKIAPVDARLAGWAARVRTFGVAAPVRRPSVVSGQHIKGSRREERGWTIFDKRYRSGEEFDDQLGFALRHEYLDLLILKRLFETVPQEYRRPIRAPRPDQCSPYRNGITSQARSIPC
jgi:hypothetical protein